MAEEQLNETEEQQPVDATEEAPVDNEGAEATDGKTFTPEQQLIIQGIIQKRVSREKKGKEDLQRQLAEKDAQLQALAGAAGSATPEQMQTFDDLLKQKTAEHQQQLQAMTQQQQLEDNYKALSQAVVDEIKNNPDFKNAAASDNGAVMLDPEKTDDQNLKNGIYMMQVAVSNYPGTQEEKVAALHTFMSDRNALGQFLNAPSKDYWLKVNADNKKQSLNAQSEPDLKAIPEVQGGDDAGGRPSFLTKAYE